MSALAIFGSELHARFCLFEGVFTAFLRLALEGPVWVEISVSCHEDVIFDSHRDFPHFEGDSFSSAQGPLPSFERAINLLNRGKAFLDTELPTNQTLFVINLNVSRASCYTLPVVFPWGVHRAIATVRKTVQPSFLSCGLHFNGGQWFFFFFVSKYLFSFVFFLPAQHLCGCLPCRMELVNKYTRWRIPWEYSFINYPWVHITIYRRTECQFTYLAIQKFGYLLFFFLVIIFCCFIRKSNRNRLGKLNLRYGSVGKSRNC